MGIRSKISFFRKVNWYKTVYFNFKKFPFAVAKKLPVFFYGPVKFSSISGTVMIDAPVKMGMVGFGQPYEMPSVHRGIAELNFKGTLVLKGKVQFGKDCIIYLAKDAYVEFGHMASLGTLGKIICSKKIVFGDYARVGSESQLIDTNFHKMINTSTGEAYDMVGEIFLGNYNYIGNRVSIMLGTNTPDYCTVASNSLCNKDYTALGNNILIGGYPAKLLKENITRDWETEIPLFEKWMKMG
jgi:hypothetical protein